jgi:hypothetical protein
MWGPCRAVTKLRTFRRRATGNPACRYTRDPFFFFLINEKPFLVRFPLDGVAAATSSNPVQIRSTRMLWLALITFAPLLRRQQSSPLAMKCSPPFTLMVLWCLICVLMHASWTKKAVRVFCSSAGVKRPQKKSSIPSSPQGN